jgi:hypothetical protein
MAITIGAARRSAALKGRSVIAGSSRTIGSALARAAANAGSSTVTGNPRIAVSRIACAPM